MSDTSDHTHTHPEYDAPAVPSPAALSAAGAATVAAGAGGAPGPGAGPGAGVTARSTTYPTTPGYREEEMELFFPHEVVKFGIIIAIVSAGLTFLATMVPMPVGEPADPLRTPAGIEPEWYFLAVYQLLKYVPRWLGVGFSFILFPAMLITVPFFWGRITRYRWGRAILNTVVGLGAIAALTLTLLGFLGFE